VVKAFDLVPPAVKEGIVGRISETPRLSRLPSGAEPSVGKDGRNEELAPSWCEPVGLVRVESVPEPTAPPRAKSESEDMTRPEDNGELDRQKLTTSDGELEQNCNNSHADLEN
jgi:hypothetical protein